MKLGTKKITHGMNTYLLQTLEDAKECLGFILCIFSKLFVKWHSMVNCTEIFLLTIAEIVLHVFTGLSKF